MTLAANCGTGLGEWARAMQPTPAVEPFPGPRPFTREESGIFKGRAREARDLRDMLLSYQLVVLHSHSGSGKSSLVNAGLIPLLMEQDFGSFLSARVGGEAPPDMDPAGIRNIYTFNALSSCLGSKSELKAAAQTS